MQKRIPLIERLRERVDGMSKAQRLLAHHVLRNYQSVAFSTVSDLARESGVSEATVVRFAGTLGFSGYPALQKEVRRVVRADLKGTERFRAKSAQQEDPLSVAIRKELENIAHLDEAADREALRRAAAMLRAARHIVVAGARSTAPLAQHLWFALDKLRLPARRVVTLDSEAFESVARLGNGDCLVAIGFPRYLRGLVQLLGLAAERGAQRLVITDSPYSALKGEIGLFAPAESSSFVAFHGAPLILINALIDCVSLADRQSALDALQQFEQLAERHDYFEPP
ncbi:MAG: MurR/RpiR family transcriptional regulator [Variibacter sp.]|nr:MurR/RpiR family transcriptional regulator [Variibacter sp.]